jgi:hypothetical protein
MTIDFLIMIFAFALGPASGKSFEPSSAPVETNSRPFIPRSECTINGVLYNPCPSNPPPPPPPPDPEILILQ